MSTDVAPPVFHLHFEGAATHGHKVPAAALIQAVQSLQRSIQLLAMAYEGHELKQRLRVSFDMERKYAVVFGVPEDGGYDLPYSVGSTALQLFDPRDVAHVTEQHQKVLEAVENGDVRTLRQIIPSAHIRRLVVGELKKMQPPARSGLVVSIEDYRHNKLLNGRTAVDRLAPLLADSTPIAVHPRLVTGRLDALEFQTRTLKLQLPNGRSLNGTYGEDFEPVLLENPREWIQVRGEAILNEDDSLKSLNNISEILEVDTSPLPVEAFEVNGQTLKAIKPFITQVEFDPEEGLYTATGDLHLMVTGETRQEIDVAVGEALSFLWREYVIAESGDFTADALVLRQQLTSLFGVNNAAR